jgi:hypothetical protein
VLSEFRASLIDKHAEERLLEKMLTLFGQKGWLKARGQQRTDSTHVLAKIRALPSTSLPWLLPTGYVFTVTQSGWNGMVPRLEDGR